MQSCHFVAVSVAAALLAGCATPAVNSPGDLAGGAYKRIEVPRTSEQADDRVIVRDRAGSVTVQMVPHRVGVSSMTVEKLARAAGCETSTGAGLLTEEGPLEIYRVQCEDGTHFLAQCELRQCRPM